MNNSIMKKIKNKFILGVIGTIGVILFSQIYSAYSHSKADTNSYLTLVKGQGVLNDLNLGRQQKYILNSGDKIQITGEESLGVINWGDGSLTRLGGNTKIVIEQNQISRDYTKINISFDLIAGKTWSNIVSFMGKDSSFTQKFEGIEAGVRGTIYEVDLENDFISVSDHQVVLTKQSGEQILVDEKTPIRVSTFSYIEIQEFLEKFQNKAWKQLNEDYDAQYFIKLKKELQNSIASKPLFLFMLDYISPKYRILYELDTSDSYESVDTLLIQVSPEKREKIYKVVFSRYQDFNFLNASDYEFYKRKIFYKKALVYLTDNTAIKEQLVHSSTYDLREILEKSAGHGIEETIAFLQENKSYLTDIDASYMQETFNNLSQDLKDNFSKYFPAISDMFPSGIDFRYLKDIDKKDLKDKIQNSYQDFIEGNKTIKNSYDSFIQDAAGNFKDRMQ